MKRTLGFGVAVLVFLGLAAWWLGQARPPALDAGLDVAESLSGDTAGYARALEVREFEFPRDHGPHPEFRTEWWYIVGNLQTDTGRRFGYHVTFFRVAVSPESVERESDWGTNQIYMAHFAVSDIDNGEHYNFERFSRGAVDLAGSQWTIPNERPFRVWLEDWELRGSEARTFPLTMSLTETGPEGVTSLELTMSLTRPIVRQGERGLSRKSAEPGNASYYYSVPRMDSAGTVTVGGETHAVTGWSWMDREWSTSVLDDDQVGWDWFALSLEDGRDMMLFHLRLENGDIEPYSHGVLVEPNGSYRHLSLADYTLTPTRWWQSPASRGEYPVAWRIQVPSAGIDLQAEPYLEDQELDGAFRYWEGAVSLEGRSGGEPVAGSGYLEMTGYVRADGATGVR